MRLSQNHIDLLTLAQGLGALALLILFLAKWVFSKVKALSVLVLLTFILAKWVGL